VTRRGYRRGVLRGVRTCIAGKRAEVAVFGPGYRRAETRWTPGSAAGCNKPATQGAEETVEVVRNHEDGTGLRGWNPRSRSDDGPSSREWTLQVHVDGGAPGAASSSRGSDMRTEPKREDRQNRSGRSVRLRRGAKVWRFARTVPSGNGRAGGQRNPRGSRPATDEDRGGRGEDQRPTALHVPGKSSIIAR